MRKYGDGAGNRVLIKGGRSFFSIDIYCPFCRYNNILLYDESPQNVADRIFHKGIQSREIRFKSRSEKGLLLFKKKLDRVGFTDHESVHLVNPNISEVGKVKDPFKDLRDFRYPRYEFACYMNKNRFKLFLNFLITGRFGKEFKYIWSTERKDRIFVVK